MKRLHIIGRKNHGKTGLIEDLVAEFTRQGLQVGTIKHTHHQHELDTPRKDSHRHRVAGAAVVGILSRSASALFWPAEPQTHCSDRYACFAPMFTACDLVLVECDTNAAAPRIEVWRAELDTRPISSEDRSILALVTEDAVDPPATSLSRSDVTGLAKWILNHAWPDPIVRRPHSQAR